MKTTCTVLAMASTIMLIACNKTQKVPATTTQMSDEVKVEVEVDNGEILVMVNGEEQLIDMSEILGGFDLENMGGEVEVHMIVEGEEFDGMPREMMGHVMKWVGAQHGGPHGGPHDNPHGSPHHEYHGDHHDNPHGEWQLHHPEQSEEEQFIGELGLLGVVADYLYNHEAVSLMGIHMIRDTLEGQTRMEALEAIIEGAEEGSPSRNAAIIVAIQTLQESGDEEGAANLMVELVLSN